jgi:fucose 4-O-acetylase-like acetyltransferase
MDVAKGILIILLLIHHFSSATRRVGLESEHFWIVERYQYLFTCFFMQAFFFISGYCSNFVLDFRSFVKKCIRQLIIPWIVFEIVRAVFFSWYNNDISILYVLNYLTRGNFTTLWFLNALFISKILLWCSLRMKFKEKTILFSTFGLLFFALVINKYDLGTNAFCIRQSLGSCFFVSIGYVFKQYRTYMDYFMKYSIWLYPVIIVVMRFLKIDIPVFTAGMNVNPNEIVLLVVISVLGTFGCLRVCKLIDKCSLIEYLGRNSLTIYGLHFLPLIYFVGLYSSIFPLNSLYGTIIYLVAVYLTEIFFCVIFIELLNTKYLKWIVGK